MTQKNTKKNKRSLNPTPIKPKTPNPEITPRIKKNQIPKKTKRISLLAKVFPPSTCKTKDKLIFISSPTNPR